MTKPATPTELASAVGISVPYASQILNSDDKRARTPSRPLAIHILRRTGWRHDVLADLTDAQIDTLEAIEPWVAPADRPTEQVGVAA